MHDHRYRVTHKGEVMKVIPVGKTEDGMLDYRIASENGWRADFRDKIVRRALPHTWRKLRPEEVEREAAHAGEINP